MRAIDYQAPTSLSEAVSIMAAHGNRAQPLAGGTDVLVQLRGGRREADVVVDTKKIPELNTLNLGDNGLQLGAAVPCYQIYQNSAVAAAYPWPDRCRRHDRQHPDPGPRHRRREPVQRRAFGRHHPTGDYAGWRSAHQRAERLAYPAGGEFLHRPGPQRAGETASCWWQSSCRRRLRTPAPPTCGSSPGTRWTSPLRVFPPR